MLVEKVHTSTKEFLTLLDHPLLVEEEQDHLQSISNSLHQFLLAKRNASTVDDHYDEVEQQLKQTKREKIDSEQSVKQACIRIMEQSEEQKQREQQLTDLLQSTTVTKLDHLRSEYKQQLERILTELEKKKQPLEQIEQAKKALLTIDNPLQSLSNKTNEWKKQTIKPPKRRRRSHKSNKASSKGGRHNNDNDNREPIQSEQPFHSRSSLPISNNKNKGCETTFHPILIDVFTHFTKAIQALDQWKKELERNVESSTTRLENVLKSIEEVKQQQQSDNINNNSDHTLQQQQLESIDNLHQSHLAELRRMKAILEKQQRLNELSDKRIDKEKQQREANKNCRSIAHELGDARDDGRSKSVIEALEKKREGGQVEQSENRSRSECPYEGDAYLSSRQ